MYGKKIKYIIVVLTTLFVGITSIYKTQAPSVFADDFLSEIVVPLPDSKSSLFKSHHMGKAFFEFQWADDTSDIGLPVPFFQTGQQHETIEVPSITLPNNVRIKKVEMNKSKVYTTLVEACLSSQYTGSSTNFIIYLVSENQSPVKPETPKPVTPTVPPVEPETPKPVTPTVPPVESEIPKPVTPTVPPVEPEISEFITPTNLIFTTESSKDTSVIIRNFLKNGVVVTKVAKQEEKERSKNISTRKNILSIKSSNTKVSLKSSGDSSSKDIVDKEALQKHYIIVNTASVGGVVTGIGVLVLLLNVLKKIKWLSRFLG